MVSGLNSDFVRIEWMVVMMRFPLIRVAAIAFLALYLRLHSRHRAATLPWGLTLRNSQSKFGFGRSRMNMMLIHGKKDKRWKNNL